MFEVGQKVKCNRLDLFGWFPDRNTPNGEPDGIVGKIYTVTGIVERFGRQYISGTSEDGFSIRGANSNRFLLARTPAEEKYVYIAYLKHPRTGTELPLSATTPEGLETKVRGHMGYEVLAKKRIKFNLGQ